MVLQFNPNGGHSTLRINTKPKHLAADPSLTRDAAPLRRPPFVEILEKACIPTDDAERKLAIQCIRQTVSSPDPTQKDLLHQKTVLLCDKHTEPNELGEYALFILSELGEDQDINLCLAKGISPKAIDHRPGEQPTALLKAVMANNAKTAIVLANDYAVHHEKSQLNYKNPKGQNAMELARVGGNQELIKALWPIYKKIQSPSIQALPPHHVDDAQMKPRLSILA